MIIELNDSQKKLLLETVAVAHMVEYMKGKDNSDLADIIEKIADSLKKEENMHIFDSVFMEYKK